MQKRTVQCTNCKTELSKDAQDCPECGTPITTHANAAISVQQKVGKAGEGAKVIGVEYKQHIEQVDKLVQQVSVEGDYHVHYPAAPPLTQEPDQTTDNEFAARVIRSPRFPLNEPYYSLLERDRQVESILEALHRPDGRPAVIVTGLGGIGKTAVAVEVARRCARDPSLPFQTIAWESAKQELFSDGEIVQVRDAVIAFPELLDSLGRQLQGPNFLHRPEKEKEQSLADILHATSCLVIVDNLETTHNTQEIVSRLQVLLGQSRVLLTSREAIAGDLFRVTLHGLPEQNSITFLRQEGSQRNIREIAEADDDVLGEIHQATQGMPLAMKLVVGQVEVLGLDVALGNLQQGQGNIYSFIFFDSWRRLSDLAKKLLLCMGPTVSAVGRAELEMVLKAQGALLDQAIQELVRLSLLTPQPLPGIKQRGYTIHQLTRYFIVNDLPAYWAKQGLI
ncbi:MAG: hypothetical protein GY832_46860 [Chloroflexi bacterium]|nr:hypothetical protein [Chloroflexota bacterium]